MTQRDDDLNEVALRLYRLQEELKATRKELQHIQQLLASIISCVGLALQMINDSE